MYKYRSILLDMESRIRNGDLTAEEFLPSEHALAAYYSAGRNTIRRVLNDLASQELICKSQGRQCRINKNQMSKRAAVEPEVRLAYLNILPLAAMDESPFYLDIFQMLSRQCSDRNWALDLISICDSNWFERYSAYPYKVAFTHNCNYSLYSMQDFQRLKQINPLIVLDNISDHPWEYTINPDHRATAALAVKHLIANGRKNIGFFCTRQLHTALYKPFAERQEGYELAMQEANLPFSEKNLCFISIYHLNFLLDAIRRQKSLLHEFDAIFAVTDLLAVLLTQVALEEKIKVPEDLSIIGYDGWKIAQFITPRIATVRQPAHEIAMKAFDLAIQLINNYDLPPQHIYLPGTLIPGETVCYKKS